MDPALIPLCLKCGFRQTNSLIFGYVCQECANRKIARRIADQQAQHQRWQRDQAQQQQHYYEQPRYYCEEQNQPPEERNNSIDSKIGAFVAVGIVFGGIWWVVSTVWQYVVYPLLHFISFGLI